MNEWLSGEWIWNSILLLGFVALIFCANEAAGFLKWRRSIANRLLKNSSVIDTALGPVEFADFGKGPVLLMLHGTPGGYDQALSLVEATEFIDCGIRFIIPSRPGYLRTPIESGATPAQQAELFDALLAKLNVDTAFVLGVSGGGPSALQFAGLFPNRCAGLILEEAVTHQIVERPIRWPPILVDYLIYFFRNQPISALKSHGIVDPVILNLARSAGESVSLFSHRKVGQVNDLTHFAKLPPTDFKAITCKTLILHGTLDKEVPILHAELAHEQIANSKFVRIEGADHSMPARNYMQLNSLIREFVLDN